MALPLARDFTAHALPVSRPPLRLEPPAADPTRTLAHLHAPSIRLGLRFDELRLSQALDHFWRAELGQLSRASKPDPTQRREERIRPAALRQLKDELVQSFGDAFGNASGRVESTLEELRIATEVAYAHGRQLGPHVQSLGEAMQGLREALEAVTELTRSLDETTRAGHQTAREQARATAEVASGLDRLTELTTNAQHRATTELAGTMDRVTKDIASAVQEAYSRPIPLDVRFAQSRS